MKKLVIIGGGHAHVEVLHQFGLRRLPGVEITLVSPDRHTPYSGMLPGLVAGHYTVAQCHIDLQPLAEEVPAEVVPLTVALNRLLERVAATLQIYIAVCD